MAGLTAEGQRIAPAAYSTDTLINFIRTWDAMAPIKDPNYLLARPDKDVRQTTQYIDGLGRPLQTVVKKGSLVSGDTARDLVSAIDYDAIGREPYRYSPFAANNTGSNTSISDGKFKLNPFQQDSTFKKGMFSNEAYYYSQTVFEASPLNRVLESYAPGDNWAGTSGQSTEANRRAVKAKNWINKTADSVRIWTVTNVAGNFGTYATSSIYPAGQLYKNVSADEHNKQVIEFKDKEGNVILKKVQLSADADTGTGKNHSGWLCTYYIYDDMNNLRCVIQPKGVELLAANGWDMNYSSGVILNEQCFRYEYDHRERMITKKVPGAGKVHMVYDARDRLVMTQDSVQRVAHVWLYTQYENDLNRPVATGLIPDASYYNNASYHRTQAASSISYPDLGSYTEEELSETYYDNYDWRSSEGNPLSATRNNSYDSYWLTASDTEWPYPQSATTQSSLIRGMVTGTKTKVLGTSTYLYTVSFYDDKGKLIQVQSTNVTGSTDIASTQYSWNGQPLLSVSKHEKSSPNAQTTVAVTKMTYDDLFRLVKTEKKISTTKVNSGAMPGIWTKINELEYDALGQLKKKKLGADPVETLSYEYNIRGWSLGMNRSFVKDTTSTGNWFGFDLGYDRTAFTVNGTNHNYSAAQYNGNINGLLWRSTGDDMLRKYDFTYDAANRIISADFNQLNSNSFSKAAGIDFSLSNMSYDANGNILTMDQKGWKLGGSITIDSLLYTYISNSNKLLNVIDRKNDTATKLGDFRSSTAYMTALSNNKTTAATDYSYDPNGNLILDNNKDIATIRYNHLNLPDSIVVTGKGTIKYVYDAGGNKLKKITTEGSTTTTTLYLVGNYVNDKLQFVGTEEGRARINQDSNLVVYDYMLKDHLGNVRMVLTEEKDTSFYPAATMETATSTTEETFYSNLPATRNDLPADYPSDTPPGNAKVAKVSGNGNKIGPAIILKVMAGDKFNLQVNSWWKSNESPGSPVNPLSSLLTAIGGSMPTVNGGHPGASVIENSTELNSSATNFLNNQSYTSGKPKAYINWILFDERLNFVSSGSGSEQVGSSNTYSTHTRLNEVVNKNGFLYIYTSNVTPNIDVFFDNLQVTHIRGLILEETHYYPFGLVMQGISSKALSFGNPENKLKYNGIEKENTFGIEIYDAQLRELDGQTGRWWQIDPKIENMEMWSPYASNYDNPILYSDPLGDEPEASDGCCKWLMDGVKWINNNLNPLVPAAEFITGRSLNSNFTEKKSRSESAIQLGTFLVPTAKGEAIIANELKNVIVNQAEKQVVKNAEKKLVKYEVGTADNLANKSVKGDGLDIHHVPQSKPANQVIKGYNKENAPAIALPAAEHKTIPTLKGTNTAGNARQQLAKDIKDLRKNTNAPNSSLQKVIELNKKMYPAALKKIY